MSARYRTQETSPLGGAIAVLVAFAIIVGFIAMIAAIDSVNASETCVLTKGGKPVDEWGPGWHTRNPLTTKKKGCFRFQRTTLNATTDQDHSDADYTIAAPDGKTSDSVVIQAIPYQVGFHIPSQMPQVNPDGTYDLSNIVNNKNIVYVYQSVGHTEGLVVQRAIKAVTSKTVQQIVQGYSANDIYTGAKMAEITAKVKATLAQEYAIKGIVIDDVLIAPPLFDPEYETAKKGVQIAIQNQQLAQAEAAATQTAAAGPAGATVQAAAAQATVASLNAEASITQANAEATAIAAKVAAYGGSDAYIQALYAQAVTNARAVYLPSGVIPFMPVETPEAGG